MKWVESEQFAEIAGISANIIARKYRRYIDRSDLVNDGYVWALERPAKLGDIMGDDDEEERTRRLRNALCNHMDRVARRAKAAVLGYEVEDEFFYALPALRDLLPQAYGHIDWQTFEAGDHEVKPTGDPAEGGNRVAELADISQALGRLAKDDQKVLFLRYGAGDSEDDIAAHLGVEQGAAHMRLERALRRLQQELGGSPPRADRPEYTGSRRVMRNASAQAITGGIY